MWCCSSTSFTTIPPFLNPNLSNDVKSIALAWGWINADDDDDASSYSHLNLHSISNPILCPLASISTSVAD